MRLYYLVKKEYILFFRNKILIMIIVYGFTFDILLAGHITYDLNHYTIAVYDMDKSILSRKLLSRIQEPFFVIKKMINSDREVDEVLTKENIDLVLVISHDFSKNLCKGETAEIQLIADGTNARITLSGIDYLSRIIKGFFSSIIIIPGNTGKERISPVNINIRNMYNPNLDSTWISGVSELLLMITLLSVLLTAITIVHEKEMGTMEQLISTPVSIYEIILAKIIVITAIILFGTVVSIYFILGRSLHIYLEGSIIFFLIVTVIHIFTSSGIGMVIATFTKTMSETILLSFLVVTPLLFLSGTFVPCNTMPVGVRELTFLFPLRWYVTIAYSIFFKSAGPFDLLFEIFILFLSGIIMFLYSAGKFRKRLEAELQI